MKFCVHSNVLGTSRHLNYENGSLSWCDVVDESSWVLDINVGEHAKCLKTLSMLRLKDVNTIPSSAHENAMKLLLSASNVEDVSIPWAKTLPKTGFKQYSLGIVSQIIDLLNDEQIVAYYEIAWKAGTELLSSLERVSVDKSTLSSLKALEGGNMHVLMTFRADDDGFAQPVRYNRFSTRTGRLTTLSGPDMLTLKKEHRHVVKSRWGEDGQLVMVDFCQLEPSIALYEAGKKRLAQDLYDSIDRSLNMNLDRSHIKLAVISTLYGQSKFNLMKRTQLSKSDATALIEKITSMFEIRQLVDKIKKQYAEHKNVINHHGRHLKLDDVTDHMFVNTYLQSTGVDVAMLGFNDLINKVDKEACKPLFVIHDALLFDCHNDVLSNIMNVKEVNVKGFDQPFAVKPEFVVQDLDAE